MYISNDTYCSATVSFHWPDTDVLSLLVHQKCFSCTNGIFLSIWYTSVGTIWRKVVNLYIFPKNNYGPNLFK